jgi:alanyl-tRNA synthetase
MKEALAATGGRGGGSKDLAQGGLPNTELLQSTLERISVEVLETLKP